MVAVVAAVIGKIGMTTATLPAATGDDEENRLRAK